MTTGYLIIIIYAPPTLSMNARSGEEEGGSGTGQALGQFSNCNPV